MKKILKYLYHRPVLGYLFIQQAEILIFRLRLLILSEEVLISRKFYKRFNYNLNLKDPRTLNEKIQWLKVNDKTTLHTICADKFRARNYIEKKIGKEYLVPLAYQTGKVQDITPGNLPDYPIIIKTNHDSSGGIIIKDKSKVNWKNVRYVLSGRLKRNYYYYSLEWQYKNIEPCIVVEKLLIDENSNIPYDYKVHCFNGRAHYISVDIDRGTKFHCRNWYDRNWTRAPFKWSSIKDGRATDPSEKEIKKPILLETMINLSEIISKDFLYVRADWYIVKEKLFIGELTFSHDGGFRPILPAEWDIKLGNLLKLPI